MATAQLPSRPTHQEHRPLLGLRDRPGRLALAFMRMPVHAYRHDAGRVLGHTFVEFTHIGRRTGQPHETVAMVLHYDPVTHEVVVCAAWGPGTDWYRNLQNGRCTSVTVGGETFEPDHRFLTDEEAFEVALRFRAEHPHRMRLLSRILEWGDLQDNIRLRGFVHDHPFVSFRPAQH